MFCVHTAISERVSKNSEKRVQNRSQQPLWEAPAASFGCQKPLESMVTFLVLASWLWNAPPGGGGSLRQADPGLRKHPSVIASLKGSNLEDSRWSGG